MKGKVAIFLMVIFLLSLMPLAFAQRDNRQIGRAGEGRPILNETLGESNFSVGLGPKVPQPGQVVRNRLNVCVAFLKKNNIADTPGVTCTRLLRKELECTQFLGERGVENPTEKCDALFKESTQPVKERAFLKNVIAKKLAEWQLKKMDQLVKKRAGAASFIEKLNDNQTAVFAHLPRAQQKKILEMGEEALKELNKFQLRIKKKDMLFKKRTIIRERLEETKERFRIAKEAYQNVSKNYKEKWQLFLENKEKLKVCEDSASTECAEQKERVMEHAQQIVVNGANMLINHLSKIKSKVESSEEVNETEAQAVIAKIEQTIFELQKAVIEAEAAQTKEELKDAAKKISNIWKGFKHRERLYAVKVVHAKVWGLLQRSEHLEQRLDATLAHMEESGIEVGSVQTKVDEFSAKVSGAKEKVTKAEKIWRSLQQAKTIDDDSAGSIEEFKRLTKEAHEELKAAHKLLVEIIKEIKDKGSFVLPEDEVESEEDLNSDEVYEVVEEIKG